MMPSNSSMGSMAGMAAGAPLGPGGMMVGAAAGGMIGGMFDKAPSGPELPWDQYNQRLSEITNYQNQLAGAQTSWTNAIANYNTTMMNLATPNLAAMYGAHGLSFDSGALATEVARQASAYQAQGTEAIAKQNFANLNNVESAKGDAWSAMFGMAGRNNQLGWASNNENQAAMGNLMLNGAITGMQGGWSNNGPWRQASPTDYSSPVTSTWSAGDGGGLGGNSLGLNFSSYAPPRTEGGF